MKKVLIVATVVKLHIMVFHIPYLEWFKKNGYEVHVAARNDYENKEECNIPFCDAFFDLPFERSPVNINNVNVYKQLKKIIDINQYEIIHCHTPIGGAIGRLAARNSRKIGTRVYYTAHGFHFYRGAPLVNWLLYYPIEKWLAKYTDFLITINKEDYERATNFKAGRIEYVPGVGIDLNKVDNAYTDNSKKRKELGIPEDATIVLSVGELNDNKNHRIVINSISCIENKKIHYIICGQGNLELDLIKTTRELGIEKQVHLLGYINDISEIYKISDIFVFPSFREGLSLSLMEAMANKLPVVCSRIRGNVDLISENLGGYLFQPTDSKKLSQMLETLIGNENLQHKFGEYNYERVKCFEQSLIHTMMERLYTDKNKIKFAKE